MKKKITAIALVAALLAIAIIGGTLAYFTDTTDEKVNTFTVGKVDIKLEETSERGDGIVAGTPKDNDVGFDYEKIVPGTTYAKKPKITVADDSMNAYVFAELTVSHYSDLYAMIEKANLDEYSDNPLDPTKFDEVFLEGTDEGLKEGNIVGAWMEGDVFHLVYSFGVKTASETITLFTGVTIPEKLDDSLEALGKKLGEDSVELNVKAYAIQEDNVDSVKDAYDQFFSEGWLNQD